MPETILDLGAGIGDYIAQRARKEPNRDFLVFEPNYQATFEMPSNVKWLPRGLESRGLELASDSVDEVHLNRVLPDIRIQGGEPFVELLIRESLRVLKRGKSNHPNRVFIREPKYSVDSLEIILRKLKLKYQIDKIPVAEAKEISESLRETALEFESGDILMKPLVVMIEK